MEKHMMEYGSEYHSRANEPFIGGGHKLREDDWQLYRSGRDAMKALARIINREGGRVLLPALCCESMILPFTSNGYELVFYRLNRDMTADREDVLKKLSKGSVLLYIRYFGIVPFEDEFLQGLKTQRPDVLIIEDRTHDIIVPRENAGFTPDATLASLRKWAALPDGGMLKTALGCCEGIDDRRFGEMRRAAMEKKSRYLDTWQPQLKEEFLHELNTAAEVLDEDGRPAKMAEEFVEALDSIDFESLLRKRQSNCLRLKALLANLHEQGRLQFLSHRPENSTLYFPIVLERRLEVQRAMAQRGIYCPVIWPEPEEASGVCENSRYMTEHMLAIPCDQRYDKADMDFIAASLREILIGK